MGGGPTAFRAHREESSMLENIHSKNTEAQCILSLGVTKPVVAETTVNLRKHATLACQFWNIAKDHLDPPFRPASLAPSLPASNWPPEACPPFEAISLYARISLSSRQPGACHSHLLVWVHTGEAAAVTGLATLGRDFLDFFFRSDGLSRTGLAPTGERDRTVPQRPHLPSWRSNTQTHPTCEALPLCKTELDPRSRVAA